MFMMMHTFLLLASVLMMYSVRTTHWLRTTASEVMSVEHSEVMTPMPNCSPSPICALCGTSEQRHAMSTELPGDTPGRARHGTAHT